MGHPIRTWSAVCSAAPHSQFGEGARPHLCMDERNCPTPVLKRLSLTEAARGKPILIGLAQVLVTQTGRIFTILRIPLMICPLRSADDKSPARLSKRFRAAGTNGRLDLSLSWRASEDPLKKHYRSGSKDSRWAKESVAPSRPSSAGWMPENTGRWSVGVGRRHPVTMRNASFKTLSMRLELSTFIRRTSLFSALSPTIYLRTMAH